MSSLKKVQRGLQVTSNFLLQLLYFQVVLHLVGGDMFFHSALFTLSLSESLLQKRKYSNPGTLRWQ
jgi:hypothetical protein